MTRWTPLPVYLPRNTLHRQPSQDSTYACGSIPFRGFRSQSEDGPCRGTFAPGKNFATDKVGPRQRAKTVVIPNAKRSDPKFLKPNVVRGGSSFGAAGRSRFAASPEKQVTPGGIRGRPMTTDEIRKASRGQRLKMPTPLDVEGGAYPPACFKGTLGGGFLRDTRFESFEFHHQMSDDRQVPNEHMMHFPGMRKPPNEHRRNSTTSVFRRIQDDPRAKFRLSIAQVMAANSFKSPSSPALLEDSAFWTEPGPGSPAPSPAEASPLGALDFAAGSAAHAATASQMGSAMQQGEGRSIFAGRDLLEGMRIPPPGGFKVQMEPLEALEWANKSRSRVIRSK